ncbi:hypothetical protein GCM10009646_12330 [Streptomyces aureus]
MRRPDTAGSSARIRDGSLPPAGSQGWRVAVTAASLTAGLPGRPPARKDSYGRRPVCGLAHTSPLEG